MTIKAENKSDDYQDRKRTILPALLLIPHGIPCILSYYMSRHSCMTMKIHGSVHRLVIQKLSMRNTGQAYAEQILSSRGCIDVKILLGIILRAVADRND